MTTTYYGALLGAACFSMLACSESTTPSIASLLQADSGGDTTVYADNANAFSLPAANLSVSKRGDFQAGNSFFREPWVIAPSSTDLRDGLGPLFNVSSCQACHIKDGRGHAPTDELDAADSLLVRLSVPAQTMAEKIALDSGAQANIPEPSYGGQIQDRSIPGVAREAAVAIAWQHEVLELADGASIELRRPQLTLTQLGYGEFASNTAFSARITPPMIGLGLLDALSDASILAREDIDDANNDGISGKANRVVDPVTSESELVGRYGWKALTPNVRAQVLSAFLGDIGISSQAMPRQNCTDMQSQCMQSPTGGQPELTMEVQDLVVFYSQHLAVPARRGLDDPQVRRGAEVFQAAGCAACHIPEMKTGDLANRPELSQQTIHPYSDLLLHDMGDDLADGVAEFLASGREWRTPPLWGIGLSQTVAGDQPIGFLHDGRARTLLEAVLWHGGEAQAARDAIADGSTEDREALMRFLESL
ncbi:MAG: di-heme oxidoredictase family protein [Oceanococcus sp.]